MGTDSVAFWVAENFEHYPKSKKKKAAIKSSSHMVIFAFQQVNERFSCVAKVDIKNHS